MSRHTLELDACEINFQSALSLIASQLTGSGSWKSSLGKGSRMKHV